MVATRTTRGRPATAASPQASVAAGSPGSAGSPRAASRSNSRKKKASKSSQQQQDDDQIPNAHNSPQAANGAGSSSNNAAGGSVNGSQSNMVVVYGSGPQPLPLIQPIGMPLAQHQMQLNQQQLQLQHHHQQYFYIPYPHPNNNDNGLNDNNINNNSINNNEGSPRFSLTVQIVAALLVVLSFALLYLSLSFLARGIVQAMLDYSFRRWATLMQGYKALKEGSVMMSCSWGGSLLNNLECAAQTKINHLMHQLVVQFYGVIDIVLTSENLLQKLAILAGVWGVVRSSIVTGFAGTTWVSLRCFHGLRSYHRVCCSMLVSRGQAGRVM